MFAFDWFGMRRLHTIKIRKIIFSINKLIEKNYIINLASCQAVLICHFFVTMKKDLIINFAIISDYKNDCPIDTMVHSFNRDSGLYAF